MGSVTTIAAKRKPAKPSAPSPILPDDTLQFALLATDDPQKTQCYGLWDMTPWGVVYTRSELRRDRHLKAIEREFVARGNSYKVRIEPARLDQNGVITEVYPGEQEMLVELAVRKIAVRDRGLALNAQEKVTAAITLYSIYTELRRHGHSMNYRQIEEALWVLRKASIEVVRVGHDEEGDPFDVIMSSNVFPTMMMKKSHLRSKAEATEVVIDFNPLICDAIQSLEFHEVNYQKLMSLGSVSRWVYKALHQEIAFADDPETARVQVMRASEIQKLCGMGTYTRARDAFQKISKHMHDLVGRGILSGVEEEGVYEGTGVRRSRVDVIYHLTVADEMLHAGAQAKATRASNVIAFQTATGASPKTAWARRDRKRKEAVETASRQQLLNLDPADA